MLARTERPQQHAREDGASTAACSRGRSAHSSVLASCSLTERVLLNRHPYNALKSEDMKSLFCQHRTL
ncbi:hypothetical protein CesoFtcFv8_027293 [Champsocephalus esox]|uniref:Uncharacterized protein n=1 Tax=Champsocephalus esox TaxID=159716 RepID=A0AAN7Y2R3_9TELE|nr:hypothetical protein CesoFtcFv8_027293 [Champsocephalus esox]